MKYPLHFRPFSMVIGLIFFLLPGSFYASGDKFTDAASTNLLISDASHTSLVSCGVPGWPSTSNITESSATFSWESVSGAQNYSVQTRTINGTWYTVPGSPFNGTSTTVSWFLPNTTYEWRVRANCYYGEYSYWTNPITFTTGGYSYCEAPTWLYTNNITQTSATLDWQPASGAQNYSLQYRLANGTWWDVSGGPWTETWHTLTGLQPGTAYQWRVRSNCANWVMSSWSTPASFTTLGGYSCHIPGWPVTSNITQNSATFSWSAVSGAQSYTVQTRLQNGTWYDLPGGNVYNTWVTVTGLNPNTTYQWRVRANCGYGQYSYWTNPITFTTTGGYYCDHPYWLYTNNVSQTSATLNWQAVPGALSYAIQWRVANGNWYELSGGPFYGTWHTVTGLQQNTCYEWRVRTNCSNWQYSTWSYIETFCTSGYSCHTPTWLMTSAITQTSAEFSWDPVAGATSYTVQIKLSNGYWYDLPGSPTYATWITATGLQPGTTYQWRVRANCGYGQYSYWSSPKYFTTLGNYCVHPTWLYTTNITQSSATLDWEGVSGALSYSIQYRLAGGTWYDLQGGPWSNTWVNIGNLQPGTSYEWRVRANCSNWQYSTWSYSAYFTTLGYSCYRPTWLSTFNITSSSATLDWSTVSGAWSYSVEIRTYNGSWTSVPGSPFTESMANVSGLLPGTIYQWRVRSNCEDGQYSSWTKGVSFTTLSEPVCNAPSWLFTNQITETTANLDWSEVNGALSYDIQFRISGGEWFFLDGGPWTETWHTATGLLPGTTYQWRVRSKCYASLFSEWSNIATFTTLGQSCAMPGGTSTTDITDSTATFNWSEVSGASSYHLQMRVPNGSWYIVPGSPFTATTVTVTGLIPGTVYNWRVRAHCANGDYSYWTSPLSFTTTGEAVGGSDECADAVELTVNTSCVNTASSNVGATQSSPAPMGWCPENQYKDVWFKFTMPDVANPVVTIRTSAGTLTDAIMEVYRGGGCSDLEYIYCEDDNNTGNGSTMPVITVTGNANATIWVRVWGYAGTTGTFNICVFDYQSNDFAAPDNTPDVMYVGEALDPATPQIYKGEDLSVHTTLKVSPNPTSDVLQISYTQSEVSKVSRIVMMDMAGKVVFAKAYPANDLNEFREQVDVSTYAPGIYILQAVTSSGILSERVSVVD